MGYFCVCLSLSDLESDFHIMGHDLPSYWLCWSECNMHLQNQGNIQD